MELEQTIEVASEDLSIHLPVRATDLYGAIEHVCVAIRNGVPLADIIAAIRQLEAERGG